jgi:hypothetical protein
MAWRGLNSPSYHPTDVRLLTVADAYDHHVLSRSALWRLDWREPAGRGHRHQPGCDGLALGCLRRHALLRPLLPVLLLPRKRFTRLTITCHAHNRYSARSERVCSTSSRSSSSPRHRSRTSPWPPTSARPPSALSSLAALVLVLPARSGYGVLVFVIASPCLHSF